MNTLQDLLCYINQNARELPADCVRLAQGVSTKLRAGRIVETSNRAVVLDADIIEAMSGVTQTPMSIKYFLGSMRMLTCDHETEAITNGMSGPYQEILGYKCTKCGFEDIDFCNFGILQTKRSCECCEHLSKSGGDSVPYGSTTARLPEILECNSAEISEDQADGYLDCFDQHNDCKGWKLSPNILQHYQLELRHMQQADTTNEFGI